MNNVLILDKPAGLTSHDTCDKVKEILKSEKAGHAGTLDSNVTGVLLIALENATKIMPLLNRLDKEYEGKAYLHEDVSLENLKNIIQEKFLGKIKQIPPKRSRVKRQERERKIYEFKILEKQGRKLSFKVSCEAGTYIRKLIDDLGKALNIGAHMTELRRIKQGPFTIKESIKIEDLKTNKIKRSLLTLTQVIKRLKLPYISVTKKSTEKLKKGMYLNAKEIKLTGKFKEQDILPALTSRKVIALVRIFFNSEEIKKQKSYVLKPERII